MKFIGNIKKALGNNEGYFIERLNEMFGDNKGYSPFTKKYYFEYVK